MVDLGGGRLLRRLREPRPLDGEAALMRLVRAAGYPAPEVFEVRAEGLVMERVEGPTMLDDVAVRPWRLWRHARTLAALHARLHRIPPPAGLQARFAAPDPADVVVHGDLHPANVLLTRSGPVVIDWANAGRGPAGADVADAWLVMAAAQPPGGRLLSAAVTLLRGRFVAAFLRHAGREEAAHHLREAAALRLADPHLADGEKAVILRLATAHGA